MDAIETISWNKFPEKIEELRMKYRESPLHLLFRGQGNSDWQLTTTLERNGESSMSFDEFYRLITSRIGPAVASFTDTDSPELSKDVSDSFALRDLLSLRQFPSADLYRYMIYLRHHGFPSPLLDWTKSPYVAAFFAFREALPGIETRSIYVYCEMPKGVKGGAVGAPTIRHIGPYVRGHRRHFRQQSDYTICGKFDTDINQWRFEPHETVLNSWKWPQDVAWKFNFPSSQRIEVLRALDEYNLNAFSLFDTEETLLETLWFREHILKLSKTDAAT